MSDIVEVGEHQNGHQIELQQGQTLRVTLSEVRTAGFRWSLRTSSQQILTPLADETAADSATAGGAAQRHWDFRAEVPGRTDLFFEHAPFRSRSASPTHPVTRHINQRDSQ
jgi:predicted secreted protein